MAAQYDSRNDMPANEKTIRIIKREQRQFPGGHPEGESKTENQTRREIFETITLWIEEQRQRKRDLLATFRWDP
jgi:ADP-ribose pyrophosphatase YjhB (NUDIX family)